MALYRHANKELEYALREVGPSQAVTRFLSKYTNVNTKAAYAAQLRLYFRWLNSKGVVMTPDQLMKDNLVCIFNSDATDVTTKRRHTDWMNEHINAFLISKDYSEAKRKMAATAIRMLYKTNDSDLFGYYETAEGAAVVDPKPLFPEDVRLVLAAMGVCSRAPLVVAWQSGIEINRVLDTKQVLKEKVSQGGAPVRVDFPGRKGHKHAFHTVAGRDSVEAVRTLGSRRFATYDVVRENLHDTARRLAERGLLKNPDLRS